MNVEEFTFANMINTDYYNPERSKIINDNLNRWEKSFNYAKDLNINLRIAKDKLAEIKDKATYNLEKLIFDFSEKFTNQGGEIYFAQNEKDVYEIISRLIKSYKIEKFAISKSNIVDELELREYFDKKSIPYVNTNIGDYLTRLNKKNSSHLVSSAIDLNLEDIHNLNIPNIKDITSLEETINIISNNINNEIKQNVNCTLSGANMLISETGSILLVENEGNIIKSKSYTKNHIVIAGIDKMIQNLNDLDLLLPMLSIYGSGEPLNTFSSIISSPTKISNTETQNLILILVNNNRTELLKDKKLREVFRCIGCGACTNVCPIYRQFGGNKYDNAYPSPIGCIKMPYIGGYKKYKHLLNVTSLCGKCTDICPVNIDLNNLFINARHNLVEREINSIEYEKIYERFYRKTIKRRSMNGANYKIKQWRLERILAKRWGMYRKLPHFAKSSFSKQYTELHNKSEK
ncbi:MAG: LUD domain-containing protein [Bacteroidales bacterium]